MKVICEFDLADEDDAFKYNCALRSPNMFRALTEYANWLRNECKYSINPENAEICRDKFWEILNDNKVDLEI